MSEFGENLRNIVMKGIEVIGNKAGDLAANAKQKVSEFNLENEQKEMFSVIGSKVFELSKQGIEFPEELKEDLLKAAEIGEELNRMRSEREAAQKAAEEEKKAEQKVTEEGKAEEPPEYREADVEETAVPEISIAAEYAARDDSDVPVIKVDTDEKDEKEADFSDCPLSSAINDLFENVPPIDKMVDKVNNSLDELGENLKKFSGEFDRQLNDFTEQMMNKDDKDQHE